MEQVAVMQNIFYNKKITKIFDLKGSLRGRFAAHVRNSKDESRREATERKNDNWQDDSASRQSSANSLVEEATDSARKRTHGDVVSGTSTLLDGDFLEFTLGRPMPLTDRAKAVFQMSILNDTLFLSIINVLDYSILIGFDEENMELVVGIIDFMRQYDILKQMERVGKSLPMVVGSEAPTIIQPPLYKARFTNAMERYFMTVPSKWTTI
jgi:Phosphatidylinositol-4-phosphate 5-Kinase